MKLSKEFGEALGDGVIPAVEDGLLGGVDGNWGLAGYGCSQLLGCLVHILDGGVDVGDIASVVGLLGAERYFVPRPID